eukprot:3886941-Rhodomonas_salina.3
MDSLKVLLSFGVAKHVKARLTKLPTLSRLKEAERGGSAEQARPEAEQGLGATAHAQDGAKLPRIASQ